ncbi:D-glycero-beta-D-manno-heptose 1-phosphate adenylyltransferase [Fulvivirga sediminis]|uniref:D-glycero-beta-D-manno-heptose 1-phosphate adenylyltransferase n=1 Tax=Fulvivirga sediminis TaxID=2803949 RepID=A0A937F4M8_9BACT|nr:D-glycero-beta-D-manno-heptose 1-phosphate adenylyltransferase [Fulvivirga sediminis]MBL3654931.1 D-glycero-beta-D-manno-heptose 1-phosphate adenylyltransferase [Fulvivirga sediminis]
MKTKQKIVELGDLVRLRKSWSEKGEKVVFTNGCFDILHLGHVDYLEKAAELGDRLIVAINTDASVKRLKGEERPLNDEYARARLLASLSFVDAVTYFSQDTPLEVITEILPDILVKGSDYLTENIVGSDIVIKNGGVVKTIDLVDGYSTTGLVNKIKKGL